MGLVFISLNFEHGIDIYVGMTEKGDTDITSKYDPGPCPDSMYNSVEKCRRLLALIPWKDPISK